MELNGEQIIKALECCSNNDECVGEECPYYATGCEKNMPKDALSLINKLTEENERLRANAKSATEILNFKFAYDAGKADTLRKIQDKFARNIGTYTNKDSILIYAMFNLLSEITKEILEEK